MFVGNGWTTDGQRALIPSAFKIDDVYLYTRQGRVNVSGLVVSIKIEQNLHLFTEMLEMTIIDGANILQQYELSGNERIEFTITRQDDPIDEGQPNRIRNQPVPESNARISGPLVMIDKKFWVMDYPEYSRPDPQKAVYTFKGISGPGFKGKYKKVTMPYFEKSTDAISKVYQQYCGGTVNIKKPSIDKHKGIITNVSPFDAIEYLLRVCHDDEKTPYYFFETLAEGTILDSYSNIVSQGPHGTYKQTFNVDNEYSESGYFDSVKYNIISISSKLGFDHLKRGMKKSINTFVRKLDISQKLHRTKKYSIFDDPPPLLEDYVVPWEGYDIDGETLPDFKDMVEIYETTNRMMWDDIEIKNAHFVKEDANPKRMATYENLDQTTHVIQIPGDSKMRPGKVIELELSRPSDPTKVGVQRDPTPEKDVYLSGKYIVVGVMHEFGHNGHFMRLKVKRDSLPVVAGLFSPPSGKSETY